MWQLATAASSSAGRVTLTQMFDPDTVLLLEILRLIQMHGVNENTGTFQEVLVSGGINSNTGFSFYLNAWQNRRLPH